MSKPTTRKLFPIHRTNSKWHVYKENVFERKPEDEIAFRWDDASDIICSILEKAYYKEILPSLLKDRAPLDNFSYKSKYQCVLCYMKTISRDGPLPELGRCDFCPGGIDETFPDDDDVVDK